MQRYAIFSTYAILCEPIFLKRIVRCQILGCLLYARWILLCYLVQLVVVSALWGMYGILYGEDVASMVNVSGRFRISG